MASMVPTASILPRSIVPGAEPTDNLDDNLAAYEKGILMHALADARGVKKRAARNSWYQLPLLPAPPGVSPAKLRKS